MLQPSRGNNWEINFLSSFRSPPRWAHAVGVAGAQSGSWSSQMNPSVLLLRPCPSSGLRQCGWRIIGSCHKQPQAVYRVYVVGATCTALETLQAQQWPPMAPLQSHSWTPPSPPPPPDSSQMWAQPRISIRVADLCEHTVENLWMPQILLESAEQMPISLESNGSRRRCCSLLAFLQPAQRGNSASDYLHQRRKLKRLSIENEQLVNNI